MDLLQTILIYMSMVFVSSVQTAPEVTVAQQLPTISPTATITATATVTTTPSGEAVSTSTPVPTPALTPNNEYKTLRVGDKGEGVRTLQSRLAELGYYTGDVDGSFGNQTRRAVERFQYAHGLSADGVAGKRTLTVLYESEDITYADLVVSATPDVTLTAMPNAEPTGAPQRTTEAPPTVTDIKPVGTTVGPTFVPTPTPTATKAPEDGTGKEAEPIADQQAEAVATASPAPEPEIPVDVSEDGEEEQEPKPEPEPMDGYRLLLKDQEDHLLSTLPGGGAKALEPVMLDEDMLVPFLEILTGAGVTIVPEEEVGHAEYAFAFGDDLYLLAYDVDQYGKPAMLSIVKNSLPQPLQTHMAVLLDGMLYISAEDVRVLTGIIFTLDEASKTLTITLPEPD